MELGNQAIADLRIEARTIVVNSGLNLIKQATAIHVLE